MVYVYCPKCGRKLLEGEKGSVVSVKCGKCNSIFTAALHENGLRLSIKENAEKG